MSIKSAILLIFTTATLFSQSLGDPLRLEARKRHQGMGQEGYNLTYGFSWGPKEASKTITFELLIRNTSEDHLIKFWLATQSGEAEARLIDRESKSIFSWSGSKGEVTLSRKIPAGKYIFEIDPSRSQGGVAEFGVKGALIVGCALDPVRAMECPPFPSKGFHSPYILLMPKVTRHPVVLVVPNNTGYATTDPEVIRASATCELQRRSSLAESLGCPLLIPLFPRPGKGEENLYLHALSREALLNATNEWKRVDLQLLAMIKDAQTRLQAGGMTISEKVLLFGFSASGSFVSRFAMLHPEGVLAVACVSPGGWPIAPLAEFDGEKLSYPVGIADLEQLSGSKVDWKAIKAVPWFFALGDRDTNDSVPSRDSFSKEDEKIIFHQFGATLIPRWKMAEALYSSQRLEARFKLYPGVAHIVSPEMESDIALFFEERFQE